MRKAADEAMDASYVEEIQTPWSRESPLTRLLLHDAGPNGKSKFHQMDIWHAIHLGIGKSWIASGVLMLQKIIPESNIDKRVAVIAAGYKDFCKREKIDPVIRRIDKETFGQSSKERTGSWNKAAVTSNFMRYLEDFCREHAEQIRGDERLKIFVSFQQWCGFACSELFGLSLSSTVEVLCSRSFAYMHALRLTEHSA